MITMVAFTTERGNPNKIGFNLIYKLINFNIYIQAGINATPVAEGVLSKMALQFNRPDLAHGCEWPAMVEFAEKQLGCSSWPGQPNPRSGLDP